MVEIKKRCSSCKTDKEESSFSKKHWDKDESLRKCIACAEEKKLEKLAVQEKKAQTTQVTFNEKMHDTLENQQVETGIAIQERLHPHEKYLVHQLANNELLMEQIRKEQIEKDELKKEMEKIKKENETLKATNSLTNLNPENVEKTQIQRIEELEDKIRSIKSDSCLLEENYQLEKKMLKNEYDELKMRYEKDKNEHRKEINELKERLENITAVGQTEITPKGKEEKFTIEEKSTKQTPTTNSSSSKMTSYSSSHFIPKTNSSRRRTDEEMKEIEHQHLLKKSSSELLLPIFDRPLSGATVPRKISSEQNLNNIYSHPNLFSSYNAVNIDNPIRDVPLPHQIARRVQSEQNLQRVPRGTSHGHRAQYEHEPLHHTLKQVHHPTRHSSNNNNNNYNNFNFSDPFVPKYRFCRDCGAENVKKNRFCVKCGNQQTAQSSYQQHQPQQSQV